MERSTGKETTLPPEIRVEPLLPEGVRYVFPPRSIGKFRLAGIFPIVFGMFFSGFAISWIWGAAQGIGQADPLGWLFALFGVPFVIGGFVPIFIGLCMLSGRSEIQVRRGKLRAIEWAGPLWWTRSRPVHKVSQLLVNTAESVGDARISKFLSAISAEVDSGKSMLMAPGYPQEWLEPVAQDLSEQCGADFSASASGKRPEVAVVDRFVDEDALVSATTVRPENTDIRCDEHADGVTIEVPPVGLWKGSKGLFGFAVFWCLFVGVFTGGLVFTGAKNDIPLFAFGILSIFWLVGIGMLLGAINMGRRRSALVVVGDTLMVIRTGIFGSKKGEWNRADLKSVKVGSSGMEVNNRPVMELQIHPTNGDKFGLLSERDNDDLAWIAGVLQKAIRITQTDE